MPFTRKSRARRARWLLPDVALLLSAVTFFHCLFIFDAPRRLFRDSDSGWHIMTGEFILAGNGLPRTDPYSFTRSGRPWFAWEWGADVLMGAAHRWDGLRGVAFVYTTLIAICTWLWFRLHWAAGGNFFIACAMASPMLSTANLHWLARPHVFSWVLGLGALLALEKLRGQEIRATTAAGFFLGGALWANLHASFLLLPALCLAYTPYRPKVYATAAVAALAGTFVNPYGWRLHGHILAYLTNSELLARIGEFQSFNFHLAGAFQAMLTLWLAIFGAALALGQLKFAHFLAMAGLAAMAMQSARGLPLVALFALPLANGAITEGLRDWRLGERARHWVDGFLDYSARLRLLDARCGGWAVAPILFVLGMAAFRTPAVAARAGFSPADFPVAAAERVAMLPADARLLAPDKFGGYLIYRFQGHRKVFFDGRSDFYGLEFMKDYIKLVEMRPGWREVLQRYSFTHALLAADAGLASALDLLGWKRLYHDKTAILLETGPSQR